MEEQEKEENRFEKVDKFGAVASTACAIHCGVCALAPAAFAALGAGFMLGHEFEWGLTLLAVAFGLLALFLGWRQHKKPMVAILLGLGIVGLLTVRMMEGGHHDEHGEAHAEAGEHEEKEGDHEEKEGDHGEDHGEEEGHDDHGPGESLGILAGLILMTGHVTNLKAMKERKESPMDDDCC